MSHLSSPFRAHIGTNWTPSPDELAELQGLIAAQRSYIDAIDDEINLLKQQISRLEEQKRPAADFVDQHRTLCHPIRRIPTEILQNIFAECVATCLTGSMHVDDFPMALLRICKDWRNVALNTPRLWSTLYIPIPVGGPQAEEITALRASGVEQWMERSRSAPLSITIVQVTHNNYAAPPASIDPYSSIDVIFPILRPHLHRFYELHLAMSWESAMPFIKTQSSDFPALQILTTRIHWGSWLMGDEPNDALSSDEFNNAAFFRSSSLRELVLNSLPGVIDQWPTLAVRWGQLTRLSVDVQNMTMVHPLTLLGVFKTAQALEDLRISLPLNFGSPDPQPGLDYSNTSIRPVILPKLKKMAVFEHNRYPTFVEMIRCPALQELEYYDASRAYAYSAERDDDEASSSLPTLLSHSGAHLKNLMFGSTDHTTGGIINILRKCPQLRTFIAVHPYSRSSPSHLFWESVNDKLLDAFITPDLSEGGDVLCPHLSTLAFDRPVGFTPQKLLSWLRVKQGGGVDGVAKLERLVVNFEMAEPTGVSEAVEELFEYGNKQVGLTFLPLGTSVTLREGTFTCPPTNEWHPFYFGKYLRTWD